MDPKFKFLRSVRIGISNGLASKVTWLNDHSAFPDGKDAESLGLTCSTYLMEGADLFISQL